MLKYLVVLGGICSLSAAESPVNGIKATNVFGGPEQHASFSFIRPGLTQTSYSFNGPSSHQSFSSSIGNPHLGQKVFPNAAQPLTHRYPGLGFFSNGATSPTHPSAPIQTSVPSYQPYSLDPASLSYLQAQQYQQFPNSQVQGQVEAYQAQLNQILALRQSQLLQLQSQGQAQLPTSSQQVPEQIQLQQEQPHQQPQNLLGVAYSAAPSVAHVKVSGNGYKFNF